MKDWLYLTQIYRYTQDERGVAERAFTEILRFGSVWHSTPFGDNGVRQLASLIADILDLMRCGALFPWILYCICILLAMHTAQWSKREAHPCVEVVAKRLRGLAPQSVNTQHMALTFDANFPPRNTYLCSTHVNNSKNTA
jgi:hypothetical protein